MNGVTLVNYNFKGGVGKTTVTGMEAYLLERDRKVNKVLLIDFDPQANLSMMMKNTYNIKEKPKQPIYKGLANRDLSNSRIKLTDKMDLIESDFKLNDWIESIANLNRDERWHILEKALKPLKDQYDYILVDVPPTLNDIVRNAIFAADGVSVVLQTQKMSYISALKTVQELIAMRKEEDAHFAFLGVILYLRKTAKIDNEVEKDARETFIGNLYNHAIKYQERVNIFTANGVQDNDFWDKRAIGMYQLLTDEVKDKVQEMIING